MKMRQPHLIPLASQAVAILREIKALTKIVVPSDGNIRSAPVDQNSYSA